MIVAMTTIVTQQELCEEKTARIFTECLISMRLEK